MPWLGSSIGVHRCVLSFEGSEISQINMCVSVLSVGTTKMECELIIDQRREYFNKNTQYFYVQGFTKSQEPLYQNMTFIN